MRIALAGTAITLLAVSATNGCRNFERPSPSAKGAAGREDGICYIEYKLGHWCEGNQVDAGTWEVLCQAVPEAECDAERFPSGYEYFGGCEWETKQERHEWVSAQECAARQAEGLLLEDGEACAYHQDCKTGCCTGVCGSCAS